MVILIKDFLICSIWLDVRFNQILLAILTKDIILSILIKCPIQEIVKWIITSQIDHLKTTMTIHMMNF